MVKRLLPLAGLALATACAQYVPLTSVQVSAPIYRDMHYRGIVMNNSDTEVHQLHFVNRYIAADGVVVEENAATAYVNVPPGQRRSYSSPRPYTRASTASGGRLARRGRWSGSPTNTHTHNRGFHAQLFHRC